MALEALLQGLNFQCSSKDFAVADDVLYCDLRSSDAGHYLRYNGNKMAI
jgi:hypothetical protein